MTDLFAGVRSWWLARRVMRRLRTLRIEVVNEDGSTVLDGHADILLHQAMLDGGTMRIYLNGPCEITLQAVYRDA